MYRCERCKYLINLTNGNGDILNTPLIIINGKMHTCELKNPSINHKAICSDFKRKWKVVNINDNNNRRHR